VAAPLRIASLTRADAGLELAWQSVPGNNYAIQATHDLSSPAWTEVATDLSVASTSTYWMISDTYSNMGFYRLVDLPLPSLPFLVCTATTNGPKWTCCETNIHFPKEAFKILTGSDTFSEDADTRRYLEVDVTIPILFECKNVQTQKCVADVSATVESTPRQADGKGDYTVAPEDQQITTSADAATSPDCDGAKHAINLKITWQAHYPTARDIKGNLKVKLTVLTAKGTINHTLFVEVQSAGGNKVTLGKPKLVQK